MSAEHESHGPQSDHFASPGDVTETEPRAGGHDHTRECRHDGGESTAPADRVRTATRDRGGPPVDRPSPVHRAVAARGRLWESYRGVEEDGPFVWVGPGDDRGG